jgi:hypothetical protein
MIGDEKWQTAARLTGYKAVARHMLNKLMSKLVSVRLPAFNNLWASPRPSYRKETRHEALLNGIRDRRCTLHLEHGFRPKQSAELEHRLTSW